MPKRSDIPPKFEAGFLKTMDRRTIVYEQLNGAYQAIVEDAGGFGNLSHIKLVLIEKFIFLALTMQRWETKIVEHPTKDPDLLSRWIQGLNSLQGLARHIGLNPVKVKSGGLKAYLEERESA